MMILYNTQQFLELKNKTMLKKVIHATKIITNYKETEMIQNCYDNNVR